MAERSIAQIQVEGIVAGKTTAQILEDVVAAHPGAKTSKFCVAWYRNHLKKGDPRVTKHVPRDPELQAHCEAARDESVASILAAAEAGTPRRGAR